MAGLRVAVLLAARVPPGGVAVPPQVDPADRGVRRAGHGAGLPLHFLRPTVAPSVAKV